MILEGAFFQKLLQPLELDIRTSGEPITCMFIDILGVSFAELHVSGPRSLCCTTLSCCFLHGTVSRRTTWLRTYESSTVIDPSFLKTS
jgi:hypothetical protein